MEAEAYNKVSCVNWNSKSSCAVFYTVMLDSASACVCALCQVNRMQLFFQHGLWSRSGNYCIPFSAEDRAVSCPYDVLVLRLNIC